MSMTAFVPSGLSCDLHIVLIAYNSSTNKKFVLSNLLPATLSIFQKSIPEWTTDERIVLMNDSMTHLYSYIVLYLRG